MDEDYIFKNPPTLPELTTEEWPEDGGWVALFDAIRWVIDNRPDNEPDRSGWGQWERAANRVVRRIAAGDIDLIGETVSGKMTPIKSTALAGIPIVLPWRDTPFDLMHGDADYLSLLWNSNADDWRTSGGDCLENRKGPHTVRLMVLARQVMECFPAIQAEATSQMRATVAGEGLCEAWLIQMMKDAPDEPSQSKAALLEQAVTEFNISQRGFLRAWDRAIHASNAMAWRQPGRRPGRPKS